MTLNTTKRKAKRKRKEKKSNSNAKRIKETPMNSKPMKATQQ
jgi:hypothetical protein